MADPVQVTNVRLTPLDPGQVTASMSDVTPAWYTLTIVVRNPGPAPVFVLASVRGLRYDDRGRRLTVELAEPATTATGDAGLPFPPRVEEVAAGAEATITHRLSSPITFLDDVAGRLRPRFVRIPEDVDVIDCTVAADDSPPPRDLNLASHEPMPDLRRWGRTAHRSWPLDTGRLRPPDSAPVHPTA